MGFILIYWFAERKGRLGDELKRKIALFCNVKEDAVIEAADASTIYEVPIAMLREKLDLNCVEKIKYYQLQ